MILTPKNVVIISFGTIIFGNILKTENKEIGDFIQGIGLGSVTGTIAHIIDKNCKSSSFLPDLPHHDLTGLTIIPATFILDKTNTIQNKEITNNLYGFGLGLLVQHGMTEGCSWCGTSYCERGQKLC